jgi:sugar fermentation stimulation protein A
MELQKLVLKGNRCAVFFLVQRMDAKAFTTADHIDPAYGKAFEKAKNNGVEVMVYDVVMDFDKIILGKKIPLC